MTNVLRFVAFRIKKFFTVSLCLTNGHCCNDLLALSQCTIALGKLLRSLDDSHSSDSFQIAAKCKIWDHSGCGSTSLSMTVNSNVFCLIVCKMRFFSDCSILYSKKYPRKTESVSGGALVRATWPCFSWITVVANYVHYCGSTSLSMSVYLNVSVRLLLYFDSFSECPCQCFVPF